MEPPCEGQKGSTAISDISEGLSSDDDEIGANADRECKAKRRKTDKVHKRGREKVIKDDGK